MLCADGVLDRLWKVSFSGYRTPTPMSETWVRSPLSSRETYHVLCRNRLFDFSSSMLLY